MGINVNPDSSWNVGIGLFQRFSTYRKLGTPKKKHTQKKQNKKLKKIMGTNMIIILYQLVKCIMSHMWLYNLNLYTIHLIFTVNGGWSTWTFDRYGSCSATCGSATRVRYETRTCTNPVPQNGGAQCGTDNTRTFTVACQNQPACPGNTF